MTRISVLDVPDLADAVYGGPGLSPGRVRALMRRWRLAPPFSVFAVDLPGAAPRGRSSRMDRDVVLALHPGIAYVLTAGDGSRAIQRMRQRGLIVGDVRQCADGHDLVTAIQRAVLALRRRQLGTAGGTFTSLVETQARTMALQKIRMGDPSMDQTLDVWLDIVLARHQERLNTVRRRMLEALCLLTLDADEMPRLAFPFNSAVHRLLETYRLPSLRKAFKEIIVELIPILRRTDSGPDDSLIARAKSFLDENYARDIGLAQVARRLNCSPTHLSRAFREKCGETLTEHLQALRVSHAKELLLETDSPLRAIAPATGFQTVRHFHRVFLKRMGMTPAAFRASG